MRKKAGVSDHLNFHILLLFSIQHPSNLQQGYGTDRCLAAWHRGGSLGIYLLLRLTCNQSSFFECHLVLTLRKPRYSCSQVPHRIPKLGCFSTVPMMDLVFSLMNLPSQSPLTCFPASTCCCCLLSCAICAFMPLQNPMCYLECYQIATHVGEKC